MNKEERAKYIFNDMPLFKAVMRLAIPSILGQLILVLYNMADTFFIGLAADKIADPDLSSALVAGVTICMPIFMILTAIANLFGVGAASVMSRSQGVGDFERARNASRFAFWGSLIISLLYSVLVLIFIRPLSNLLSGFQNPDTAVHARTYILVCVVIGGAPTVINNLLAHLLRAEGKSLQASLGIAIGGLLNVALDPLFIFVITKNSPALGVALATAISNTIALIYYLIYYIIIRKKLVISFKFKPKMFLHSVPKEVLLIGLPACLMTLCENISYLIMGSLIGSTAVIGQTALAGEGAAKKINMFAHSTVRGMTQGVLPIIGYNKSSGNRKRMKQTVYLSGGISLGIAIICTICSICLSRQLSSIFLPIDEQITYSARILQILALGAPFSAIAYTVISFFQAVGKPYRSLILALLRKGIVDIPLMFILSLIPGLELYGIVLATPIADIICFITSIILFSVYIKKHGHDKPSLATNN